MDWQRLNAYVDGELDPAAAAEVAASIARSPDLAARVATLSRLKAAAVELEPGAEPPTPRLRRWTPRRLAAMVAAAAVVVAIGLGAALRLAPDRASGTAWLEGAVVAHAAWLDQKATDGPAPAAVALGHGVPDLTDARLTLDRVTVSDGSPGRPPAGTFAGYRGSRGCRVGLWIADAAEGLGEAPSPIATAGLEGYAWRAGAIGYALVARGMDKARLAALADAVSRITHRQQRLDEALRTALRDTSAGTPCLV